MLSHAVKVGYNFQFAICELKIVKQIIE